MQWCHGAAGVVTSLAALAHGDEVHGTLRAAGGELVWKAGPIARSAGLCHGTAGNGFAFLALLERTGDERCYALFTGDVGAALLAAACLRGATAFPGLDDL